MAVDPPVLVEGEVHGVADHHDIWILVRPAGSDRVYMQSGNNSSPSNRSGNRFSSPAYISLRSEILVVVATESASSVLSETLESWGRIETFPGFPIADLPSGLKQVDCVVAV